MKTFRIAVVGCGGVSRMHFEGYASHPDRVCIVGACDTDKQRAERARDEYGFEHAFGSVREMLDGADWEVGVLCTPTPVREQLVGTLAEEGKHIFVEKPMADSLAEGRRIVEACERVGVRLAVNQNFRLHYGFDIARSLIASGRIGKVHSIILQSLFFRQDEGWRTGCERHALSVMGVHWLDGFRWMLGSDPASIFCRTSSSDAIDCAGETDASVQIAFSNGTTVSCVQSFSSAVGRDEAIVVGEKGTLVLNGTVELYDKDHRSEPTERWENPYAGKGKPESAFAALEELLDAIEKGREPSNSGRDNLKTVALLDAAYRSASEGRVIEFEGGLPK